VGCLDALADLAGNSLIGTANCSVITILAKTKNCVAPHEIHYFPGKPVNIKHSWQITYDPSFRPTHSSTIGAITAPSPMVSAVRANRISASLLSASVELASPVLRPARLRVFRTVPRVSSLLILHYARRRMLAMFRLHWKQWIP